MAYTNKVLLLLIIFSLNACFFDKRAQYFKEKVEFKEINKHFLILNNSRKHVLSSKKINIEFSKIGHDLIDGSRFAIQFYEESSDFTGLDRTGFEELTIVFNKKLSDKGVINFEKNKFIAFYSQGIASISSASIFGYSNSGSIAYEWIGEGVLEVNISLNIMLIDLYTIDGVLSDNVTFKRKLILKKFKAS